MNFPKVNGTNQVAGLYKKTAYEAQVQRTDTVKAADKVSLSDSGKIFAQALQAAKDAPDIRTDKVQKISEEIKAGKYQTSPEQIAEKFISGALFDKKI